uniref:AIG1-type G domain-containing protein n=1 Tax=Poecilia reticulata TaxID=8081 RepID=A0A3P9P4R1_POERE
MIRPRFPCNSNKPDCGVCVTAGTDGWRPALSLILLGRRKSGKSSAGNMILGREEFQRDKKTVQCEAGHAEISGWSVTVVDTPGWSLFGQILLYGCSSSVLTVHTLLKTHTHTQC